MPNVPNADIPADSNADQSKYAFQSFGAQFVEVRVNPEIRRDSREPAWSMCLTSEGC